MAAQSAPGVYARTSTYLPDSRIPHIAVQGDDEHTEMSSLHHLDPALSIYPANDHASRPNQGQTAGVKTFSENGKRRFENVTYVNGRPSFFADGAPGQLGGVELDRYPWTDTLFISDLHWYTSADQIIRAAAQAGVYLSRNDIVFAEHKVNGKSKGAATLSCTSQEAAARLMQWFHINDFQGKKFTPVFATPGAAPVSMKPTTPVPQPGRPLTSTQALLAHGPTNAHGGVNFNRVRPNARVMAQQAHGLGIGLPMTYVGRRAGQSQGNTGHVRGQSLADPNYHAGSGHLPAIPWGVGGLWEMEHHGNSYAFVPKTGLGGEMHSIGREQYMGPHLGYGYEQ